MRTIALGVFETANTLIGNSSSPNFWAGHTIAATLGYIAALRGNLKDRQLVAGVFFYLYLIIFWYCLGIVTPLAICLLS